MFLSADTLSYLFSLGLDGEKLVELVRRLEADAQAVAPVRSSGAARQARYRDSKRNSDVTDVTQQRDVTPLSEGSQGSLSPTPPNLPNPPNLSQEPPIVPQKPARKARLGPAKGAFARFWAEYPLKVGKLAAEKAYAKAWGVVLDEDPDADPEAQILAGLVRCKPLFDPEFIQHPTTWLNKGGWMDQPEVEAIDGGTGPPKFDLAAFEARRAERDRERAA